MRQNQCASIRTILGNGGEFLSEEFLPERGAHSTQATMTFGPPGGLPSPRRPSDRLVSGMIVAAGSTAGEVATKLTTLMLGYIANGRSTPGDAQKTDFNLPITGESEK